ncbi:hypothetical protein L1049_012843 [Liquidambar formosana]|uniref:Transcription repressor n=1 Tax=Liquidambar formosana TaxID=63359 RepID=A0AAP0RNB4_LIQFO
MGNHRFRLSDMMPNAWFYKLKDMSRTRNHNTSHSNKKKPPSPTTISQKAHFSQPRYSYYFNTEPTNADKFHNSPKNPKASDTHFPDPPRKSSKRRPKRKTIYKPSHRLVSSSVSAGCSCRFNSVWTKPDPTHSPDYFVSSSTESSPELEFHQPLSPEFEPDSVVASDSFDELVKWSGSCSCRVTSSTTDIIIDVNNKSFTRKIEKLDDFNTVSEIDLPPILTKPAKFDDMTTEATKFRRSQSKLEEVKAHGSLSIKIVKEDSIRPQKEPKTNPVIRKSSANSTGVKLRSNSPRLASRKIQAYGRKSISSNSALKSSRSRSLSESFAIVKSSVDPQRDFRDSMVEMIVENNIRASKDLEELLACYLQLNSDVYHDLIVKAFEQIWFDMTSRRM